MLDVFFVLDPLHEFQESGVVQAVCSIMSFWGRWDKTVCVAGCVSAMQPSATEKIGLGGLPQTSLLICPGPLIYLITTCIKERRRWYNHFALLNSPLHQACTFKPSGPDPSIITCEVPWSQALNTSLNFVACSSAMTMTASGCGTLSSAVYWSGKRSAFRSTTLIGSMP